MKVGSMTESQEVFYYRNQRFSDQRFVICVRSRFKIVLRQKTSENSCTGI